MGAILTIVSISAYADNATALLERTSLAAKHLNYDGIFALQSGDKLQSIRIIHRNNEQGEIERLISLSGVEREVIRTDDSVMCVYPDGEKMQPNHQPLGRGFPSDLLSRLRLAMPYYNETLGEQGRVAGHQAQEVNLIPKDNYRYAYRLWIAKDNDLLLQSDLLAEDGRVLEMFSFSSVEMGIDIPELLLKPQMQGNTISWDRVKPVLGPTGIIELQSNWKIAWLPQGFNLIVYQNRIKARNGAAVEQRVYSDGLSSISVFMEKIRARHSHLHGGSRIGAVNAFGSIIKAHFVTVVGSVPARTVEKIGNSIQYND
ncbi:MAG: MucB/RseB C-terminal domain-containing protein [Piscirickettsiaceae bacterium]|nr:MucB/RseB C-terminal domain-containing protein [Piscirickettsiaceae bacterium]